MASGKGKKILIGFLGVLIVAGAAIGIYAWYFGSKHKTEYGEKGKITKKAQSQLEAFEARLTQCKKEVFLHKDLPYKPKAADRGGDFKKAVEAVMKGVKTCLQGQKSADGKGWSGKMSPKYLDELLTAKECPAFADNLTKFKKCQFLFEELPDHAGFDDGLGDDGGKGDAGGDAMGADAKKGDDMAADAMGADAKKADDMAADAMKADAMGADAKKADDMAADAMKGGKATDAKPAMK